MRAILKRLVVWLLEVLVEALLLGCLLGALVLDKASLLQGVIASMLAVPVFLFLQGYYVTRAFFAVVFFADVWRSKVPWLYPMVAGAAFVAHVFSLFGQLHPDLSAEGRSTELPFLAGGACIVFACAFGGGWLLRMWAKTGGSGQEAVRHGIVADSAGG